jgi:hypothetical protein
MEKVSKKQKKSVYEIMQMEALFNTLNETEIFFYRKVCRWYSEKFHTPLHEVTNGGVVSWDEMLLNFYEHTFDNLGYNEVYKLACEDFLPEIKEKHEAENDAFAKALEEEQKATMEKAKSKKENKVDIKNKDLEPPPGMSLNFEDEDLV